MSLILVAVDTKHQAYNARYDDSKRQITSLLINTVTSDKIDTLMSVLASKKLKVTWLGFFFAITWQVYASLLLGQGAGSGRN